jgi:hypothetical protein
VARKAIDGTKGPDMAAEGTGSKAIRVVGEGLMPGVSLLMDGDIKSGTLHLAGGVLGRMVFGPAGWLYAAADSYSKSQTGKHFHQHFFNISVSKPEKA